MEGSHKDEDLYISNQHLVSKIPKDLPLIRRTDSISGKSYHKWRMFLWKQVTKHLKNNDYPTLSKVYEYEKTNMLDHQLTDRAGIVMCRKGISTFFNQGLKPSLSYMKRTAKYTDSLTDSAPNTTFIRGNVSAITGFLYVKKNKLGNAWNCLLRATRYLQLAEYCEFTAELNYALATFYFKLSSIYTGNGAQKHRLLAIRHAEKSWDICAEDFDKGEWYGYYAVESLYLLLMIKTNADAFIEVKDFEQLSDEKIWSTAKMEDIERLLDKLNSTKQTLENNYIYMDLGITKCQCMLHLRKILALQTTKQTVDIDNLYDAGRLCTEGLQMAQHSREMCDSYFAVNKGCIKAKYVHQISLHFAKYESYFEQLSRQIVVNIDQKRPLNPKANQEIEIVTTSDIITSEDDSDPLLAIENISLLSNASSEESQSSGVRL